MRPLTIPLISAVITLSLLPCSAGEPSFCIVSPDHPPAWYNIAGDKLSQKLTWSDSKEQLRLHVAYSQVASPAVWRDQTLIDTFELSFPSIHLNRITNRLYFIGANGREIDVGHLAPGPFGTRVVLDDNVELSAHRHDGVIRAAIESGNGSTR